MARRAKRPMEKHHIAMRERAVWVLVYIDWQNYDGVEMIQASDSIEAIARAYLGRVSNQIDEDNSDELRDGVAEAQKHFDEGDHADAIIVLDNLGSEINEELEMSFYCFHPPIIG